MRSGAARDEISTDMIGTMIRQHRFTFIVLACLAAAFALNRSAMPGNEPQAVEANAGRASSKEKPEERPLFVDWPQPELTFFITGRQNGYMEPCGCTGLDFQKGGLARRETLLRQLSDKGWNPVPIDVGNQVRRFGRQPEIKFETTLTALKKMKYEAIGLGPDDLRLGIGELLSAIGVDGEPTPVISSNVNILLGYRTHKVIRRGRFVIGITSFLGEEERRPIQTAEIEYRDSEEGVRIALAELEKEKCNLYVLLAHASTEESIEIAKKFPKFGIVVTAGGADEPALQPERIEGTRSYLVQTGKKGMYVGVLGIFPGENVPMRFQRVPLDARFADSREMLQSLASYQQRLEDMGLLGLGLKPVRHPSGLNFVGSKACQECHSSAYDKWETTPHHEATKSLAFPGERSEIPRHHDPECLSCHVTGWNPQGYFPYETGYLDFETSAHLHGNGCENCHGPGSGHVAAERGEGDFTDQQTLDFRHGMQLPLAKARDNCLQCHDLDNDPDFQKEEVFADYWELIEHGLD
jgi:hypothetical protein